MTTDHTVSSIGALIVDFLKKDFQYERTYLTPTAKDAVHERLQQQAGYVFDWHTWNEIGLAQKQAYGNDLSSYKTFTVTQSKAQLRLMADVVRCDPFADNIRVDQVMDVASRMFKKQVARTGWEWMRGGAFIGNGYYNTSAGFDASGSESWTTPTHYYAGGTTRADMITGSKKGKAKELHQLAAQLALTGTQTFPDGTYHLSLSHFLRLALIKDDDEFRELHEGGDLTVFVDGKLPRWGSFSLAPSDMPFREASGAAESTGSSYAFSGTGDIIVDWAYGPGFFGDVMLGKGGMVPEFKFQDISLVPNANQTLGWSLPYAAGIVNANFGLAYITMTDASLASAYSTT